MRKFVFLLFFVVLCHAMPVYGATTAEPAFRNVVARVAYPWSQGLIVDFEADERQCKAKYGAAWRVKCSAALGRYGDTVKGVKLSPAARGHWQWSGPTSMVFVPAKPDSIRPDRTYSINLDGLFYPAHIKLDKTALKLRTPPLSVRLADLKVWVDPSPRAQHRLGGSFEFNYPVPENLEDIGLLPPPDASFGNAEKVWSHNRDKLNISWPVKKLPQGDAQASVNFPNMAQVAFEDGVGRYWGSPQKGTTFKVNLPGANNLFRVGKIDLKPSLDEDLNRCYLLEVESSLYANPGDVQKNLHIWQLPKYGSKEATIPLNWAEAPALSSDALKKALESRSLDNPDVARSNFKFRVKPDEDSYIAVLVADKLRSASGQKLIRPVIRVLKAEAGGPNLAFLQPGNILPLNGKNTLDFYATDLDRIVWEAQLVRDPFLALLAFGSDRPFERPLNNLDLDMDSLSVSLKGELPLPAAESGKARFTSLDLGPVVEKLRQIDNRDISSSGLVRVSLKGMKDGKEKAWATRMVLPTDIGLLVKRGARGGMDIFAHSLGVGKEIADAKVSILGANGKAVVSANTDDRGHVAFPSLNGMKRESRPVAAIAEHDGQLAWLPLGDASRELNYSEFPTGGAHALADGLNTFVFSQRGIYLPGDTLYFGCIARNADFSRFPAETPLYAELLDPRGIKIHERVFSTGDTGMAEISWPLSASAQSGRYTLNILTGKEGSNIGSATVRVEEFQPDTLKMKIEAPKNRGWVYTGGKDAKNPAELGFALQNLYGTPAAGHDIKAQVQSVPARFYFPEFAEYTFTDASPLAGGGVKMDLPEAKTGVDGTVRMVMPRDLGSATSAKIIVSGEGFDLSGGRATVAQTSFLASPMPLILGYRPLQALTNLNFIPQNQHAELEFIALDPQLEKSDWKDIKFTLANRAYVTSLVSDGNGGYRYDETPADLPLKTWTADLTATGLKLPLDTSVAGDYLLTAQDAGGRIIATIPYAVAGERLDPPGSPLAGGKMRLRLEKNEYNSGDYINMVAAFPYDGTGLITIERDGVAAFDWLQAKAGENTYKIRIPDNFEGKGYVVVSFVRSTNSPAIYMAPHTYAVAPFSANIKKRDMNLAINAPQKVLPGKELVVNLSAQKPGKAVLFAVDEGILQLTGYTSPKPLDALLADRALDVRTLQAFDLLMPDHALISQRFSAFGGGMEGGIFGKRFNNPFKRKNEPPLATWSSLVEVGPEPVAISIPIPDYYNGALRLMAVGCAEDSAGGAAASSVAVAPLALTPALPLAVSPGDIFEGSLIIANTDSKSKSVNLDMRASVGLRILNMPAGSIDLAAGEERALPFRVEAVDLPGAANIEFRARDGAHSYVRKAAISLRPASSYRATLMGGMATGPTTIKVNRRVYPQNAQSVAMLSGIPLPLAAGLAQYLDTYPYGCSEQLISRAFAQTLLRSWPQFSGDNRARQKLLDATLGALRARFKGDGISLWPDGEADPLLTAYAADFLLTLHEAGIGGAEDLLNQLCDALEANCVLNESSMSAARVCAYSIWTLTRQGRVTTQLVENLAQALDERNMEGWGFDLTALLLAASQKEMRSRFHYPFIIDKYNPDGWFDEFAQQSLHMTLLARYFPNKLTDKQRNSYYVAVGEAMLANSYATFSASQGIRALMTLAGGNAPNVTSAHIQCADKDAEGISNLLARGALQNYGIEQCEQYQLDMPPDSPELFWQIATSGYDRNQDGKKVAHGLEIKRRYLDENGKPVKVARQGDIVNVEITARALTDNIPDCALVDLLPGGFEMVLKRGPDQDDSLPAGVKYIDRQEDRMLVFADLANKDLIFTYTIRATNPGIFTIAPISGEAMYNQNLYGRGEAGKIEVRGRN